MPKTIEQTDKKYKGGCCLGSVLVVGGLILLSGGTGAMRYQLGHDADSWVIVGAIFLCLGLATLIGSAFLSRWHHG